VCRKIKSKDLRLFEWITIVLEYVFKGKFGQMERDITNMRVSMYERGKLTSTSLISSCKN